ncbi:DNA primase-helicase [Cronobacter phage vB_CsaM_GAP32]|uniref:DNA primase-helicase n=1 Tax=Cronobacter phage vB_CsaM_GAP32 TaxID=1141136 RepID=K4F663_9CAUD|nr:DNA primase-helicase [Cronobacter phage vB_CsaM_GAP32]AFC21736.1 DNA primase-helicase [Cronobacter phage vB_CsaM_GAP32]
MASNTDVRKYDISYQLYLLSQIFSTPDLYVRCKNVLKPDYFDKEYHASIQYVHDYSSKYNITPTLNDIKHNADFQYSETPVQELNQQAVLDSVGEFCRHKALALAIQQGMELVNQKRYGGIEELIREAMLVTVQNDLGLDIYENPEEVISSLANMQGTFKSGWETLDYKLFGGFGRQELEIFAAASGGGKSVVLQNLAVNFSKAGLNGAYITLELASELVAVRIYGMMVNTAQNKVKVDIDETAAKIKIEERSNGKLRIHRLPESVSTVNDIESYIRELQIKTGVKLDYVCVDYLDLLTSDRCGPNDKSNAFVKDKFVSEELRALAMKMDLTVFTACQFNRSGVAGEDVKSQAQIAGGISKIYTADNVIYIDARKDRGEMVFDFQKTRNSSAVGSRLIMSYDIDSLRVLDHPQTVQEMEINTTFRHSGKVMLGKGNVMAHPTLPGNSAMSSLQNKLTNVIPKPSTQIAQNSDSTESPDINTPKADEDKVSRMRDFLNGRI